MIKRFIIIKGKKEILIKVNGVWIYKYHRCGCPCKECIHFPNNKEGIRNHKRFGVPNHIGGHQCIRHKFTLKRKNICLKKDEVFVKGKIEKVILENNILVYKYHFCQCGCEERIPWNIKHYYVGISRYISGHNKSRLGKTNSKIHRLRIKLNRTDFFGENNPNFGNYWSEEQKEKQRGPRPNMRGENNGMFGKPPAKGSNHGKHFYYKSPLQGEVCLRSSWELAYAKYLDSKTIIWKYEHKAFKLSNGTTYRPDFFLVKNKKYREIKGYMTETAQEKIDLFQKEYNRNFKVLYHEDLVRKGIL